MAGYDESVKCTCNMVFEPVHGWTHHPTCAKVQWRPGHLNTQTAVRMKDFPVVLDSMVPKNKMWLVNMDPVNDPERRKFLVTREQLENEAALAHQRLQETLLKQTTPLVQLPARESEALPEGLAAQAQRMFATGATRDVAEGKNDYEGFLSPLVLEAYGDYMRENQTQPDGSKRESDNWQLGIPRDAYVKSFLRHAIDFWKLHRGWPVKPEKRGGVTKLPTIKTVLCAILFNVMGYLHELLREELEGEKKAS